MKTNYLLSSLCLAPLAVTAPLSHAVTLVAGKSTLQPAHQIATIFEQVQHVLVSKQSPPPSLSSSSSHTTQELTHPSKLLDVERPMTTAELLALTYALPQAQPPSPTKQRTKAHKPTKAAKKGSKKISVGTLVVPSAPQTTGVLFKVFDPQTSSPYLIPGQYVSSQRADVLIVGLIIACVLIVVLMESWEMICSLFTRRRTFTREGPVRLIDNSTADVEQGAASDSDEDCDAPFGGFRKYKATSVENGLLLPEKADEKATWI